MIPARYKLFSDGSAEVGGYASCACIVENDSGRIIAKLCALLPELSPLEAEMFGGLIGLEYLTTLEEGPASAVCWHCDSLTLINDLNSNRPELAPLQAAARSFRLTTEHVSAHTGHSRNEACDKACRWIRKKGEKLLREFGEGEVGLGKGELRWSLQDRRGEIPFSPSSSV